MEINIVNVKGIKITDLEWTVEENGRKSFKEIEGTEREIPCDLALLAIGFVGPDEPLIEKFGVNTDPRSNAKANLKDFKIPGLRLAKNGEFSYRSVLNGKNSLKQAKAINQIISNDSFSSLEYNKKLLFNAFSL